MAILNTASSLRLGTAPVVKAYMGSVQVWPAEEAVTSELRQQQTGTWDGTGFTVTLPQAPAATSTLVLIVAGNTLVTTPAGWTLREWQVNQMGHYLYTCTGTTASSWPVTTANGAGTWWVSEVTHSSFDVAVGNNTANLSTSHITPFLVPNAGPRMLITSIGSLSDPVVRTTSGWTNEFVEVADICQESWDYPMQGVATRVVTADGTSGYQTQATFEISSAPSAIICALAIAGGGGGGNSVPQIVHVTPADNATDVALVGAATVSFDKEMNESTMTASSVIMQDMANVTVPTIRSYNPVSRVLTITPTGSLEADTQYTITLSTGIEDTGGTALATAYSWSFTTVTSQPDGVNPLAMGHGGPILLVTKEGQPFGEYYSEILRAEGLNSFDTIEINDLDATALDTHDVILLGDMVLTNDEVTTLEDWVDEGGKLIAMRPDKKLTGLLGIIDASSTFDDTYLKIDTTTSPGLGITSHTMQYHGTADRYTVTGDTTVVASLCSDASNETVNPAVTLRNVGTNGGVAVAFTYDLARSVTLTHQGNPAWSGQDRNGDAVIRPNDLFHGAMAGDSQPDYIDLNKVAIPQADEQQRLLANIINEVNKESQPLPRFSYLPYNDKAVVVLVCDDHATESAASALDHMIAESPEGGSVDDWECVRSTSLLYTHTPLSNAQVAGYAAQGFDFGVHINTNGNWTPESLATVYDQDLGDFQAKYTSIPPQRINRNHMVAWSDYTTMVKQGALRNIRLDLNYYYWPGGWVQNRPGFMTGSGMTMRFADFDGTMIDVYQLASHLVNESGQTWPQNINLMLQRALGPEGYYGILGTHYDYSDNFDRQLIQSAKAHNVRLVSGEQILKWTDGRNGSYFTPGSWSGAVYSFSATVHSDMRQMGRILLPMNGKGGGVVVGIERDGTPQSFTVETMKGVSYAVFMAATGTYEVTYGVDVTPPEVIAVVPGTGETEVGVGTDVLVTLSEPLNPATVTTANVQLLEEGNPIAVTVSYEPTLHAIRITPSGGLVSQTAYTIQVGTGVQDTSGVALDATYTSSFTTTTGFTLWAPAEQTVNYASDGSSVELGLRFQSSQAGEVTQIKFYKSPSDPLSTHTATLWSPDGIALASANTSNETASGWQTAELTTPVPISAATTYTVSYTSVSGHYCYTGGMLGSDITRGPLTALSGGGRYRYPSGYPESSFNNSCYWVDVCVNIV